MPWKWPSGRSCPAANPGNEPARPSHDPTHEVAQGVAPDARVVYVDKDPLVLAHARALLASNPHGGTDYIEADLYDPGTLVSRARAKLDFGQPVAIMLMGVMGHVGNPGEDDDQVAASIVDRLKAALPSGGYLVMYEGVDTDPRQREALEQYNQSGAVPYRLRNQEQIARFFDGLELVDPAWYRSTNGAPTPARSTRRACPRSAESPGSRDPRGYPDPETRPLPGSAGDNLSWNG